MGERGDEPGDGKRPTGAGNSDRGKHQILRIVRLTWDSHDLGLSLRLTRVGSAVIHRTRGARARKGAATSRPSSAPKVE